MSSRLDTPYCQVSTDGYTPLIVTNSAGSVVVQLTDGSYSAVASFTTVPVPAMSYDSYRFQCTWPATGAAVGSLTLQATIDASSRVGQTPNAVELPAANWAPLSFSVNGAAFASAYAVTAGGGQIVLDENRLNYGWVRAVFTYTSGTFTPIMRWALKGNLGR
jgi:hypothetical protein